MKTDTLDLRRMDCMDLMREFPDGHFDLAIVDPPYGIGEDGSNNASRGKCAVAKDYKGFAGGDKEPPSLEYFDEIRRVSRHQIIWGANHFMDRVMRGSPAWIVWDKENGTSDFADAELAYSSFKSACRVFRFRWAGMLQGDMANKEARIHPTQKPVALYRWLLANYAKPGQRILDTHLGSGSIAIASHYFGAHLTACEIDEDYFKAACERIDRETRQLTFI
jgi:site-specific DNA-methyltransferase (adenine-specific)